MDKWVVIKIATKENIAFAKWVKLPKNQAVTVDETFTAKCDANSIYFGLGGDFGDRDDEKDLYTWAEGGKSAISDGDGDMAAKATVITCTDYSLAAPAAASDNQQNNNGGNTTQPATNTTTVATGDFGPYACAVAAIAAAAVIVVFSRKRKEA